MAVFGSSPQSINKVECIACAPMPKLERLILSYINRAIIPTNNCIMYLTLSLKISMLQTRNSI